LSVLFLVLIIEDKKDYGSINVSILAEAVPELSESFTVSLGDIQLVTSRYINYGYMNGLQVDMPPETGPKNKVEFSILKNDDAHGVVEFRQSRLVVHEHDGRVVVSVLRTGGSYWMFY
jgi:G-protein coupled receptor 98